MRKTALVLVVTAACILYSCKKNGESPHEGTKLQKLATSYGDGTGLDRTINTNASDQLLSMHDETSWGGIMNMVMEYGAGGKITKTNFLVYQGTILFYYEFEYNTDGTVRKKQVKPGSINLADDYHTYAYDAAGRLVSDSIYTKNSPAGYGLSQLYKFIYTGDNVTESEYYEHWTGTPVLRLKRKFEYDNGINPFKNLDNYYFIIEASTGLEDIKYVSSNNVVKEYATDTNMVYQLFQTYKYKYNSSNYPWKYNTEVQTQGQILAEVQFFYKQ